jgi:hypothetical protein
MLKPEGSDGLHSLPFPPLPIPLSLTHVRTILPFLIFEVRLPENTVISQLTVTLRPARI